MLMTISSSSSGTLVLVLDRGSRACGGVEYSFRGFSKREDSEGLDLLLSPMACPGDGDSLFIVIRPLGGMAVSFGGSEKVFLDFDPYGGLLFCDRALDLCASPTFLKTPP